MRGMDVESEARRKARLAMEIVAEHTGPLQTILAWTRKYPEAAAGAALLVGIILGSRLRTPPPAR